MTRDGVRKDGGTGSDIEPSPQDNIPTKRDVPSLSLVLYVARRASRGHVLGECPYHLGWAQVLQAGELAPGSATKPVMASQFCLMGFWSWSSSALS